MWAPGNKPRLSRPGLRRGFTLFELLLVVAIIAAVGAGVGFALRDNLANDLERDAQQLAALLEAARAQSRATGVAASWLAVEGGYMLVVPGASAPVRHLWRSPETRTGDARVLLLGPEPIIAAQQVELTVQGHTVRVATDGLRPFSVQDLEVQR